jgi:hypothetical protein
MSKKPGEVKSCCGPSRKRDSNGQTSFVQGITYAVIPHIGCIAFIVGSVLGVTMLMEFFKPLLMNRWFFHILIGISMGFATLSSWLYLRKHGISTLEGVRGKWRYLSTMYGSTIGINIMLFLIIFPMLANVSSVSATGALTASISDADKALISMSVDIPCPGHAPLISEELKTVGGVAAVKFSFPNVFDVIYDSSMTTTDEMLSLDVFSEYPATMLEETLSQASITEVEERQESPSAGSCCGSSTCGSSAGSCGCGGW